MAKITRKTQKIFGNNATANDIAVFGTMKTGEPQYSTDLDLIQNATFLSGWADAILEDKAPFMEDMNAVQYSITRQLAYLYQQGVAEWDANTEYSKGSVVSAITDNNLLIYMSLIDNNVGRVVTDNNSWKKYSFDDLNQSITALQTGLEGKVSKTGDTMTGSLTQDMNMGMYQIYKMKNYTTGTAPSANTYPCVEFQDKNGARVGRLEVGLEANGTRSMSISMRHPTQTSTYCTLKCGYLADGTWFTQAPTPATGDNSTKIATTAWVVNHRCTTRPSTTSTASINAPAYIIKNYLNGASGYVVYSDGYCEQWGQFTAPGFRQDATVTFLKTFSGTGYQILLSSNYYQHNGDKGSTVGWKTKNTNNCVIQCCFEAYQPTVSWRACGWLANGQW